jgi:beta-1,4-mannosyl-glycoprotein beta-1,4-N-acetylglucosaminyltransferase
VLTLVRGGGAVQSAAIVAEIWDCFFFNDELDLLEARLHELGDFVDRIVLVEGDRTFAGAPKPLVFDQNRERFLPWADKIVHLVAHLDRDASWVWDRENQQRAVLGSYLERESAPEDLILLGDVDEIPDRDAFPYLRRHYGPPLRLRLHHAVYFVNWLLPRPWSNSTLVFRPSQFPDPMVRLQLGDSHREWQGYRELQLDDAGVHASFLGGVPAIRRKLTAYSHQELNEPRVSGAPHLERCVEYGVHFQRREPVRRLKRDQLNPLLRRLSERPESAPFFDFRASPLSDFQTRAYCGYSRLRSCTSIVPERLYRLVDRHPGISIGPGAPMFWLVDAAIRLRRRLRPKHEWALTAYVPKNLVGLPIVERWR